MATKNGKVKRKVDVRAKNKAKKAVEAAEKSVQVSDVELFGKNPQMWKHEALAEWITQTHGIQINATQVAAAIVLREEWRKSDSYQSLVTDHRAETYPGRVVDATQAAIAKPARKATKPAKAGRKAKAPTDDAKPKRSRKVAPKVPDVTSGTSTRKKTAKKSKVAKPKAAKVKKSKSKSSDEEVFD